MKILETVQLQIPDHTVADGRDYHTGWSIKNSQIMKRYKKRKKIYRKKSEDVSEKYIKNSFY
jgi:hypothetical protein